MKFHRTAGVFVLSVAMASAAIAAVPEMQFAQSPKVISISQLVGPAKASNFAVQRITLPGRPDCYVDATRAGNTMSYRYKNGDMYGITFDNLGRVAATKFNDETYQIVFEGSSKISPVLGAVGPNGIFVSVEKIRALAKQRNANKERATREQSLASMRARFERKLCSSPLAAPAMAKVANFKKVDAEEFPEEWLDEEYWIEYITVYATPQSPVCDKDLCLQVAGTLDLANGLVCIIATGALWWAPPAAAVVAFGCGAAVLYYHQVYLNTCNSPPSGWNCD